MRNYYLPLYLILIGCLLGNFEVKAQESTFIYGDALPDAPELAVSGNFAVGVKTLELINKDQLDINNIEQGQAPIYDRKMVV